MSFKTTTDEMMSPATPATRRTQAITSNSGGGERVLLIKQFLTRGLSAPQEARNQMLGFKEVVKELAGDGITEESILEVWETLEQGYREQVINKGLHVEGASFPVKYSNNKPIVCSADLATQEGGSVAIREGSFQVAKKSLARLKAILTPEKQAEKWQEAFSLQPPAGFFSVEDVDRMFDGTQGNSIFTTMNVQHFFRKLGVHLTEMLKLNDQRGAGVIEAVAAIEDRQIPLRLCRTRINRCGHYSYAVYLGQTDAELSVNKLLLEQMMRHSTSRSDLGISLSISNFQPLEAKAIASNAR